MSFFADLLHFSEVVPIEFLKKGFKKAAVAVDPHIGLGASGKKAAEAIEDFSAKRCCVGRFGNRRIFGESPFNHRSQRRNQLAVSIEKIVASFYVDLSISGSHQDWLLIKEVFPIYFLIEVDVTGRFFKGGASNAAIFNRFGSQHRNIFDCKMSATELADRIVAIAIENAVVKVLRLLNGCYLPPVVGIGLFSDDGRKSGIIVLDKFF